MNFEWTVPKTFADIPEREYINDCCIGGDEILNQLKPDIASQMNVDKSKIEIYQEDWGWALEFSKDEVFYSLGLNNNYEGGEKTDFAVVIEANRKVKKFLFTKSVEATNELNEFAEVISNIARINNFEVREN
jgi:predicted small secreted protein